MTGKCDTKPKNKMLKLLKNDFIASTRVISLFYLLVAISLAVFFVGTRIEGDYRSKLIGGGMIAAALLSFLLIFVTFFFVLYDFRKSLFSEQGYLSFTLPVTSNQLLGSKMIVYGGWMLISYGVFYEVLKFTATYAQDEIVGEAKMSMAETFLTELMGLPSKAQIVAMAVYLIVLFFIIVLTFVSMLYFAITASYVRPLNRHSVMSGVAVFVANSVVYLLGMKASTKLVDLVLSFGTDGTVELTNLANAQSPAFNIAPFFYMILQSVVLFYLTSYLMHKKVNVK